MPKNESNTKKNQNQSKSESKIEKARKVYAYNSELLNSRTFIDLDSQPAELDKNSYWKAIRNLFIDLFIK